MPLAKSLPLLGSKATTGRLALAIGVSLGVVGAIVIVVVAANSARDADMPSIVIYTIGLLSMLGFSAAYNTWPISRAKWVLRRFDHSAIYVMIAGTYTAFIGQMRGDFVSISLLIGVWLTAVVGVTLKLLLPGRFDRLAVILYLILGWSGAVAYEPVVAVLPSLSIWLLVPLHRGFDWLSVVHRRTGRCSGSTSISILRATPGCRLMKPDRSNVSTIW
jgi:channel protein (hemolysin III family)